MRLDKFLSHCGLGSRKEVKNLIKKGIVKVNQEVVREGKRNVNEDRDEVYVQEELIIYQSHFYYLLNKPKGVISAVTDKKEKTVIDILKVKDRRSDLFPVGRLDKDTEGLLLLTNDGLLAHELLSPKKHVEKEYFARIAGLVGQEDQKKFKAGLALSSGEVCLPAQLIIKSLDVDNNQSEVWITLCEGKFHQVKRMFEAVDKRVTYLQRIRMGTLLLDSEVKVGNYRELFPEEVAQLKNER